MNQPNIIRKTALAIFKDKKMIMVRNNKNHEVFYTLGGRIEEGEAGTLIKEDSLQFLRQFEALAHGRENTLVNIQLYMGELIEEPKPSSEIVEIQYFDSSVDPKHLTPITLDMFEWLKSNEYIA
jgi:hypothetical protein